MTVSTKYHEYIWPVAHTDATEVLDRDKQYGSSWKKRGGVGAYMMLARKIDRIEKACEDEGWDVFKAVEADPGKDGLLDDIRDLRRYLILVESEVLARRIEKEIDNGEENEEVQ